jgi:16S rRNA (cytosine967-C5)-methyltransferase
VTTARSLAVELLTRIEHQGAYANLVVPAALKDSGLGDADRRFVTELVHGTTRMRRACDALVDRFITVAPDAATRTVLRLGAYQLVFAGVPAHAAVGESVGLAPRRTRGFVNAVLRQVATRPMTWPSDAARLSYPDWIVERIVAELGHDDAMAALERMDAAPPVTVRSDGYVQDLASTWVADAVDVGGAVDGHAPIVDVCAAPGGKATRIAGRGGSVVALDLRPARVGLVTTNAARLGVAVAAVVADATAPPVRSGSAGAVLLDAPCSGLGALRRRPDARWRIGPDDVDELVALQRRLLVAAADLVAPGGQLVYSVCTLTAAESIDHPIPPGFEVDGRSPPGTWRPYGHGWRVLPHDADTDGMVLLRYRRAS